MTLELLRGERIIFGEYTPLRASPLELAYIIFIYVVELFLIDYMIWGDVLFAVKLVILPFLLLHFIFVFTILVSTFLYYWRNTGVIITNMRFIVPRDSAKDVWQNPPLPFDHIEEVYTNPHGDGVIVIYRDLKGKRHVKRIWTKKIGNVDEFISILRNHGVRIVERDYVPPDGIKIEW